MRAGRRFGVHFCGLVALIASIVVVECGIGIVCCGECARRLRSVALNVEVVSWGSRVDAP
jgi:hypothetical protein